ncbi:PbsX family transcriptional regulator, partial [Pediococcus acidilactici]|nr:PbsX family transcriptional regulator [Pediococcus acidilactici]
MNKTKSEHIKQQALDLFTRLQFLLQKHDTIEPYQYVLDILETGISTNKDYLQTHERK